MPKKVCPTCNGEGLVVKDPKKNGDKVVCPTCGGKGQVRE